MLSRGDAVASSTVMHRHLTLLDRQKRKRDEFTEDGRSVPPPHFLCLYHSHWWYCACESRSYTTVPSLLHRSRGARGPGPSTSIIASRSHQSKFCETMECMI
ncbi:hypothetical protein KC19_2G199700 [Ceratodon purpureus]|uniref:Uncharacterized protein n=1 Tax=Ceratodon purpureus TaxID=3225 RepID=A0A8T0IY32_CERPU|nr:hypothetical protein KC19_2G199700 [Ceratodon purpureus]